MPEQSDPGFVWLYIDVLIFERDRYVGDGRIHASTLTSLGFQGGPEGRFHSRVRTSPQPRQAGEPGQMSHPDPARP